VRLTRRAARGRVSGVLGAALLLAGCAHLGPPPPTSPPLVLRLSPASLGGELSLGQRVTVVGRGPGQLDGLLEADATSVRLAMVAMGQVLLALSWDGADLEVRASPLLPEAFDAGQVLSDVQLAWWPAAAIRAGLPPGYALEEAGGERRLLRGGVPVATVRYEGTGPAWAHVHLKQLELGYELDIESTR
jgi:hypothetical protein